MKKFKDKTDTPARGCEEYPSFKPGSIEAVRQLRVDVGMDKAQPVSYQIYNEVVYDR